MRTKLKALLLALIIAASFHARAEARIQSCGFTIFVSGYCESDGCWCDYGCGYGWCAGVYGCPSGYASECQPFNGTWCYCRAM